MSVDMKIFMGLLIAGILFVFMGLVCIIFAYINRDGNERQKSHGPFGVFLLFLGIVLTLADTLTANAFMAAVFGLLFAIVVFHYGVVSIMKKRKEESREQEKARGSKTTAA